MRTGAFLKTAVVGLALACTALHPARAAAEPIPLSGFLFGQPRFALIEEQLELFFPDFTLVLDGATHLNPGFCRFGCENGRAVPLTQSTGFFAGHSSGLPGFPGIDADVAGTLSFVGPTEFINIASERFATDVISGAVQLSGLLTVTQAGRVLFDGTLAGSGMATVLYANRFNAFDTRLDGYQYQFTGVAATPEPASLVLVGTGMVWLWRRRRKSARANAARAASPPVGTSR